MGNGNTNVSLAHDVLDEVGGVRDALLAPAHVSGVLIWACTRCTEGNHCAARNGISAGFETSVILVFCQLLGIDKSNQYLNL